MIALLGVAVASAGASAAQRTGAQTVRVAVKPAAGSPRAHFAISIKAPVGTGRFGPARGTYRVTASEKARGHCQSSAGAGASPTRAGATSE